MGALITPHYVKELAAMLDVKAAYEWALAFALASAPLPEGWTSLVGDDGSVSFIYNLRPQSPQREHPLLERAARVLAQMRNNGRLSVSGDKTHLLGPFENSDSPAVEYFYLDILTGEQLLEYESPPGAIIDLLQQEFLSLLTTPRPPSPSSSDQEHQEQPDQRQGSSVHRDSDDGADGGVEEGAFGALDSSTSAAEANDAGSQRGDAHFVTNADTPTTAEAATGAAGGSPGDGGSRAASANPVRTSTGQSADPSPSRPGSSHPKAQNDEGSSDRSIGTMGVDLAGATAGDPGTELLESTASHNSRPASAATSTPTSSTLPAPPPPSLPAPPSSHSPLAPEAVGGVSSKSTGLNSDDYDDNNGMAYMRGESTTAGYAGSISENGSRSGIGKTGGSSGRGAGGGADMGSSRDRNSRSSYRSGGSGGGLSGSEAGCSPASMSRPGSGSTSGSEKNSGSHRSSSGGVGVRAPVPPPSGRLTFHGWWFEDIESSDLTFRIDTNSTAGGGLAPRHCTLVYDFTTLSYTFTMRDPVTPPAPAQPYERIPVLTVPGIGGDQVSMIDTGRPADLWDLHLGARLRVLGRQVFLKNCDLATAQWHASYFRQLWTLRDKLQQEVQKYKPRVLRPGLVADKGEVRLQTGQQLRHVALQVRELIEDLRQYRPGKAESFMAALPIQF